MDRSVVPTFAEPDKCRENSGQRKSNFRFYLMIFDFHARQGVTLLLFGLIMYRMRICDISYGIDELDSHDRD